MKVSTTIQVLAVELDCGTLFLSAYGGSIGTDALTPATQAYAQFSSDGVSLTVEQQALPDYVADEFWTNCEAALLEVELSAGSVYDGRIIFDGVVSAEPNESNGVLTLTLIPKRRKILNLPAYGVVDAATYPAAPAESLGLQKPLIFGVVDDCPLIPVKTPFVTGLSSAATPGDIALSVLDALALPEYGAVWVDNESVPYSSHDDKTLYGCAIKHAHSSGTTAALASEQVYLAAGNACLDISTIKGDGARLSADRFNNNQVFFARPPLIEGAATLNNVLVQFDQVATAAFTQTYPVSYPSTGSVTPVQPVVDTVVNTVAAGIKTSTAKKTAATVSGSTSPAPKAPVQQIIVPQYLATALDASGNYSALDPQFYSAVLNDGSVTTRVVMFAAGASIDIPATGKLAIALDYAASQDLTSNGIAMVNTFKINNSAVDRSVTLNAGGTITFTSSISVIFSRPARFGQGAFRSIELKIQAGVPVTLADLLSVVSETHHAWLVYKAAAQLTFNYTPS